MELIKTLPGDFNFKEFVNVPEKLHPMNFIAHKEFERINTEFLESCYLVKDGAKLIGSIALYNNPGHYYKGERTCCVGYFHCTNDEKIVKILVDAITEDVKRLNINYVIGPMNGTTWESYRFRISDNQFPFFLETANPIYYNDLFKASGFFEIQTYYSYLFNELEPRNESSLIREKQFVEKGIIFRDIRPENYAEDMRKIFDLCLISFKNNLFFTPYTWESYIEKYKLLESFVKPELTMIAEDENKNVVGFIFIVDDIFCQSAKRFVSKTYAVHPNEKYKGLGGVILQRMTERLIKLGYTSGIHAYIMDGTVSSIVSSKNSEILRTYKLYALNLNNN
ncbi:MAG: hypothetical protein KAR57_00465 [Bacteroidales bacterium]|nr:hypothetical protein [Bacteroidales bacterium]